MIIITDIWLYCVLQIPAKTASPSKPGPPTLSLPRFVRVYVCICLCLCSCVCLIVPMVFWLTVLITYEWHDKLYYLYRFGARGELLSRVNGGGISVTYTFLRQPSVYGKHMNVVELTFFNHSDHPIKKITMKPKVWTLFSLCCVVKAVCDFCLWLLILFVIIVVLYYVVLRCVVESVSINIYIWDMLSSIIMMTHMHMCVVIRAWATTQASKAIWVYGEGLTTFQNYQKDNPKTWGFIMTSKATLSNPSYSKSCECS